MKNLKIYMKTNKTEKKTAEAKEKNFGKQKKNKMKTFLKFVLQKHTSSLFYLFF